MLTIERSIIRELAQKYNFTEEETIGYLEILITELFSLVFKYNFNINLIREKETFRIKATCITTEKVITDFDLEYLSDRIQSDLYKYITYNLELIKIEKEFRFYKMFVNRIIKGTITGKYHDKFIIEFNPKNVFPIKDIFVNPFKKEKYYEMQLYKDEYIGILEPEYMTPKDMAFFDIGQEHFFYCNMAKPDKKGELPSVYMCLGRNNIKIIDLMFYYKLLEKQKTDVLVKCTNRKAGFVSYIISNKRIDKDIILFIKEEMQERMRVQYGDYKIIKDIEEE